MHPRLPILERITQEIVETLGKVTRSSGYSVDLIVERPDVVNGNPSQDCLAVVTVGTCERVTDGVPYAHTQWEQQFEVACTRIRTQHDDEATDALLSRVSADVIRAITQDKNRAGLAQDTWIDSPVFDYLGTGANAGVATVHFTVIYRTLFNDPFSSAYES